MNPNNTQPDLNSTFSPASPMGGPASPDPSLSGPPAPPTPEPSFPPEPPPPPFTPPPPPSEPIPTWTPPSPASPSLDEPMPEPEPQPQTVNSALDNPFNAPPAPPPIDNQPTPIQPEPAPTDLSHLVENESPVYTPPLSQPETLITPQNGTASVSEIPNVPGETEGGNGIPKWVLGLGIGILLAVMGASAYFILGVGKPQEEATSLPATVEQKTLTTPPPPVTSPTPATGTGTFGEVGGTKPATSAADLLKQRQGR